MVRQDNKNPRQEDRPDILGDAMTELRVRVDDSVIEQIDTLVSGGKFSSRAQFVNEIISTYLVCGDKIFAQALPTIVSSLCSSTIEKQQEYASQVTDFVTVTMTKALAEISDIRAVLYGETQEKSNE